MKCCVNNSSDHFWQFQILNTKTFTMNVKWYWSNIHVKLIFLKPWFPTSRTKTSLSSFHCTSDCQPVQYWEHIRINWKSHRPKLKSVIFYRSNTKGDSTSFHKPSGSGKSNKILIKAKWCFRCSYDRKQREQNARRGCASCWKFQGCQHVE